MLAYMSNHFDMATAKEDPFMNWCDFYVFRGRPGSTVMFPYFGEPCEGAERAGVAAAGN
jgi:hypothetical protein